ncbi:2Fe-2S iron-sulfur cluster binding domain-containing protein [Scytonema sp. UIC 10036]|uniref:(2Fe-2S)-binding protein n=1 Tax=Scytonema sp. UIC 10036 TaxID=2304196 RepID=UPI0012DA6214|nr:(2Fe-2S)-binding protein [Scytonema sp. UIC 10036]MUG95592.1 2Fe-2S iron-sulfur cluster binding domain-containing protein [Scytonema sp. UIC 10036]
MTKQDKPENRKRSGVTRRGFFKRASFTVASAAIVDSGLINTKEAAAAPSNFVGPGRTPIQLRINGMERRVEVEPHNTLAEVLRFKLGLTGTKVVCDRGSCSACTVWLDSTPVCSCMMLVIDVGVRAITTIEGLAKGENLHPVQSAFIEYDAMQCGYCTPGMVMSCAALLARNSNPTLEDVQAATSGNLCRCGTYPKVFEATLAAAKSIQRGRS